MKSIVFKGSDYLSAEETVGELLDRLGVLVNVPDEFGDNRAIISKDVIIEVRLKRKRKVKNYEKTLLNNLLF